MVRSNAEIQVAEWNARPMPCVVSSAEADKCGVLGVLGMDESHYMVMKPGAGSGLLGECAGRRTNVQWVSWQPNIVSLMFMYVCHIRLFFSAG